MDTRRGMSIRLEILFQVTDEIVAVPKLIKLDQRGEIQRRQARMIRQQRADFFDENHFGWSRWFRRSHEWILRCGLGAEQKPCDARRNDENPRAPQELHTPAGWELHRKNKNARCYAREQKYQDCFRTDSKESVYSHCIEKTLLCSKVKR
jgi:hypothetical protein